MSTLLINLILVPLSLYQLSLDIMILHHQLRNNSISLLQRIIELFFIIINIEVISILTNILNLYLILLLSLLLRTISYILTLLNSRRKSNDIYRKSK